MNKCETCGKKLDDPILTHCSPECLQQYYKEKVENVQEQCVIDS